jgi:NAD(P)-dependent dehydrogenase (short-subunit alcohol dehydrogenase family)
MADAVAGRIRDRGGRALAVKADVFDGYACRRLVDETVEAFGRVDICIIGPGAGWHPEPPGELDAETALDDARRELAPVHHLMPLVLPGMRERQWGRLVGIALEPSYGSPAYAYNAGKAARTHALLLAEKHVWKDGVTINVIAPGPVPAIETLDEAVEQCDHGPAWRDRKTASPQDAAESVAMLCSEAGRFVSGAVLPYRWTC